MARSHTASLVIVCDVDLLLEPTTGQFDQYAATALERLLDNEVPIVLCSSRTRAQLERFQQEFGFRHPFIPENGAAVFLPDGYFSSVPSALREAVGYRVAEYGPPYDVVVERLHRVAARTGVQVVGFSDLSVEDIAAEFGLSLMQARLAKLREYDEPFRIDGDDSRSRARLFRALASAGLGCRRGRRYDHAGAPVDKSVGIEFLSGLYRSALDAAVIVGFGTAPADVSWLRHVDVPVVLDADDADIAGRLVAVLPRARVASAGAAGWMEAVLELVAPPAVPQPPATRANVAKRAERRRGRSDDELRIQRALLEREWNRSREGGIAAARDDSDDESLPAGRDADGRTRLDRKPTTRDA